MSNFWQRTLTGFIFITVMIVPVALSEWGFAALFFVINILSLREFYSLMKASGSKPDSLSAIIFSSVLFATSFLVTSGKVSALVLLIILPLFFLLFFFQLFKKEANPFGNIAISLLGIIYISVPLSLLNLVAFPLLLHGLYMPKMVLGYFYILWAGDTGAYLAGSKFGKTKLFERISPKKSWEGSIGGLVVSLIVAYVLASCYQQSIWYWFVIALLIVVAGTLGDLTESLLKRSIGVKDSGNLMPGHGGMLDRFDGLYLSIPFVVAWMVLHWFLSMN